ncbi:MAG: Glutamate/gamma-aminobutyrate antiporter [Chlamydiia bacterium]|nr:Glutamate/gamma-aminobutyrate antiporter [Chlamydiia bacterium]
MELSDTPKGGKRVISIFVLVMLNVAIMASLRNLPLVASYGFSVLSLFLIVGICFLLPCALVSAELATGWPKSGGIYIWVREAFGDTWGFVAIWLQWIHNVAWYPAILSFIATTIAYVLYPPIATNIYYVVIVILATFWGITLLNFKGIKMSAWFSTFGVIAGTIAPGVFLILLGFLWLTTGRPSQITFSFNELIPDLSKIENLSFLGGLFLAFAGLEVSSGYASEVKNPQKNYPKGIIFAAAITFFLFMLGSLSIGIVIPIDHVNLVAGLMEALKVFLDSFHISWLLPVLGILLVFGAIGEVNAWIIGPVKALFTTTEHGNLPPYFQVTNKKNVPVNLLVGQAIIVTIVSMVFTLMPNLSSAYWILTALSTQLYLLMYILMFLSAIKLRYSHPLVPRAYKIPHPHKGIWAVSILGILTCIFAFLILFVPPAQIETGSNFIFETFLIVGLVIMCSIPFIIHSFKKPSWYGDNKPDHLD